MSWTLDLNCGHAIDTDGGIKIIFPSEFYVRDTNDCTVGEQDEDYTCVADTETRSITIMAFSDTQIAKETDFIITFDNVMNPGVENE